MIKGKSIRNNANLTDVSLYNGKLTSSFIKDSVENRIDFKTDSSYSYGLRLNSYDLYLQAQSFIYLNTFKESGKIRIGDGATSSVSLGGKTINLTANQINLVYGSFGISSNNDINIDSSFSNVNIFNKYRFNTRGFYCNSINVTPIVLAYLDDAAINGKMLKDKISTLSSGISLRNCGVPIFETIYTNWKGILDSYLGIGDLPTGNFVIIEKYTPSFTGVPTLNNYNSAVYYINYMYVHRYMDSVAIQPTQVCFLEYVMIVITL